MCSLKTRCILRGLDKYLDKKRDTTREVEVMGQDREKEARGRKSYLSVESLCADGVISRKRKRSKRLPVN